MPYGTTEKPGPVLVASSTCVDYVASPKVHSFQGTASQVDRSGSNVNSPFRLVVKTREVKKKPVYWYETDRSKRVATLRINPRTGQKYYKRSYMKVLRMKMVSVYGKTGRKVIKRSNLLPNSLSTQRYTTEFYGSSSSITGTKDGNSPRTLSGDLACIWEKPVWGLHVDGQMMRLPVHNTGDAAVVADLDARCLTKLYERVKNQSTNLATAMAQGVQTKNLIADAVMRIIKALLAIKRLQFTKALRSLLPTNSKAVANDYLAYQFGVKPLISDINGILNQVNKPESSEFTVNATVKSDKVIGNSTQSVNYYWKGTLTFSTMTQHTVKYSARIRTSTGVRDLGRLGFTNPAALAWEIIPWSFIIDWLIPIGNYLNSQDAFVGCQVLSVHRTVIVETSIIHVHQIGGVDAIGYTWPSAICGWKTTYKSVVRTPLPIVPALTIPSIKSPVSFKHILLSIALLRQR